MLLNIAPAPNGSIPVAARARYKEFGDWIRGCYNSENAVARTSGVANNSLVLMTIHQSKGLEFDHVYVVGAHCKRERAYPLDAEEVRVYNVAITRCIEKLRVSWSKRRLRTDAKTQTRMPINMVLFPLFKSKEFLNICA